MKEKTKVGVLLIALGKYIIFMDSLISLAEKNFLPNCKKTYYIITDSENDFSNLEGDVVVIRQQNLGWPLNTLWRYSMFLQQNVWNKISSNDYIFFLNADALVVNTVKEEDFLPLSEDQKVIAVRHSVHTSKDWSACPFERRQFSSAYVKNKENNLCEGYFVGGIVGGKTDGFRDFCFKMIKIICEDLNKAIIPQWHDESVINHLVNENPNYFKKLSREYCFSIEDVSPLEHEEIKIAIRPKYEIGGRYELRSFTPIDLNNYIYNDKQCKDIINLKYKDGSEERLKISFTGKAFRCKSLKEIDLIKTNYNSIAFLDKSTGKTIEFFPEGNNIYRE